MFDSPFIQTALLYLKAFNYETAANSLRKYWAFHGIEWLVNLLLWVLLGFLMILAFIILRKMATTTRTLVLFVVSALYHALMTLVGLLIVYIAYNQIDRSVSIKTSCTTVFNYITSNHTHSAMREVYEFVIKKFSG